VCDDWLKALGIADDPQARMSHAEVMTVALVTARYDGGNLEQSRKFLAEQGYIPNMLGKSRYNRRLRAIPENVWQALLDLLATIFKFTNEGQEYCLDSGSAERSTERGSAELTVEASRRSLAERLSGAGLRQHSHPRLDRARRGPLPAVSSCFPRRFMRSLLGVSS
jgi:hypothetical protein